ncbi:helix-turn-helix domain-containing protein [Streptomyces sp. MCAF7]
MPTVKPSTVLGRQLGDELRRFRESAGLSTAEAAEVLDCTKGKISRIENGHVPVRAPDLTALMHAYGVQDAEARERLEALARRANRRRREGWWHQYESVLGDAYRDQIEMESICESVRTYEVQLIPGLLQTPTGNMWLERESEVACYRELFDDSRTAALPPTESLAFINLISKEYQS